MLGFYLQNVLVSYGIYRRNPRFEGIHRDPGVTRAVTALGLMNGVVQSVTVRAVAGDLVGYASDARHATPATVPQPPLVLSVRPAYDGTALGAPPCLRLNCVPNIFQPSRDPSTGWHRWRR